MLQKLTDHLTKRKWRKLAGKARQGERLAGFFHENYIYNVDGQDCLFRFVLPNAAQMNPVAFDEVDVLGVLTQMNVPCPKLIYKAPDKSFYVEEAIHGQTMEMKYPPGDHVPEIFFDQLIEVYQKICQLDTQPFMPFLKSGWPKQGTPYEFFLALSDQNNAVYKESYLKNPKAFGFLGFGEEPYKNLREKAKSLALRPLCFMHGDFHRGNIIENAKGEIIPIDWELSMYGDLMYCFSRNIHIGRFYENESQMFCQKFKEKMPAAFTQGFEEDFQFYLTYEALRSVITDTIRFPEVIKEGRFSAKKEAELCLYYADNLARIAPVLGTKVLNASEALQKFQEWGHSNV